MTEADWVICADPQKMLEYLRDKASDRKLRLFGCACCRQVWNLLLDPRSQKAVMAAEDFADGLATIAELSLANFRAHSAVDSQSHWDQDVTAQLYAAGAARDVSYVDTAGLFAHICDAARQAAYAPARAFRQGSLKYAEERTKQLPLLRDIFGNPFRPATIDASWLTSTVVSLARPIYDERAFDRLPILADALEDAGCTNDEILNHCRQPGEHVRGCWAVDLVLGKK
jgi:hypothetical protein